LIFAPPRQIKHPRSPPRFWALHHRAKPDAAHLADSRPRWHLRPWRAATGLLAKPGPRRNDDLGRGAQGPPPKALRRPRPARSSPRPRGVLPEIGATNYPAYLKAFGEHGGRITLNRRLRAIRRAGNRLAAVLYDEYARADGERVVDQVVVEHGTLPADELYFALKPLASNRGEVDQDALRADRSVS
jgi:hypothetical protein